MSVLTFIGSHLRDFLLPRPPGEAVTGLMGLALTLPGGHRQRHEGAADVRGKHPVNDS